MMNFWNLTDKQFENLQKEVIAMRMSIALSGSKSGVICQVNDNGELLMRREVDNIEDVEKFLRSYGMIPYLLVRANSVDVIESDSPINGITGFN
jgi:hypothetical protein